jgi:hypothetical protein
MLDPKIYDLLPRPRRLLTCPTAGLTSPWQASKVHG